MSRGPIDYRIRPAKHVERRMLAELLRCLNPFGRLESYRYIGFGAIYFSDFILFHRALGITNMLSMERDAAQEARFLFNVPYSCIELDFRDSNAVLPSIQDWEVRTIAWLDYTDKINGSILADITCFLSHACPGSVLLVSVNCKADQLEEGPLERLLERVGKDRVPKDLTDAQVVGQNLRLVSKRLIDNAIRDALETRNGMRKQGTRLQYRQLVNFHYADGVRMLTVGGILVDEGQPDIYQACGFGRLDFLKTGDEAYEIEVPLLTVKEKKHLDGLLPSRGQTLAFPQIPKDEITRYEKIYRYFPSFVDAEP